MPKNHDLDMPEGLSAKGRLAYDAIVGLLRQKRMTYTGGCRAFRSPKEWEARGERYGCKSELVVVYDGGDLGQFFSLDQAEPGYGLYEEMRKALALAGVYAEECTGWYAAIYPR